MAEVQWTIKPTFPQVDPALQNTRRRGADGVITPLVQVIRGTISITKELYQYKHRYRYNRIFRKEESGERSDVRQALRLFRSQ